MTFGVFIPMKMIGLTFTQMMVGSGHEELDISANVKSW